MSHMGRRTEPKSIVLPVRCRTTHNTRTEEKFDVWVSRELALFIGSDTPLPPLSVGNIEDAVRQLVDHDMLSPTYVLRLLRLQKLVINSMKVFQRKIAGWLIGTECSNTLDIPVTLGNLGSITGEDTTPTNSKITLFKPEDSYTAEELSRMCVDNQLYLYSNVGIELQSTKYHEFRHQYLKDMPRSKWVFLIRSQQMAEKLCRSSLLAQVRIAITENNEDD